MLNTELKSTTRPNGPSLQPIRGPESQTQGTHDLHYSFGTLTITDKSRDLIQLALDKGRLSCGRYVREFEQRFADLVGVKEAVAVSSGTDADALALAVLYDFGAQRGDEIIVPALSFVATGNAVLQAGFKPVFVDIDLKTLCIDQPRSRLPSRRGRGPFCPFT